MAILNRIVNILILLLIIAAGVFSYMLFQKRESLTKGMKDMAGAIANTAKTLDDGGASGTKAANNLKPADLDHKKDFKKVLPDLDKTAREIVAQRNSLAKSIETASRTLGASGVKSVALRRVDNYEGECKKFQGAVRSFKENSDGVKRAFVTVGNTVNARISVSELEGTGYTVAANKIKAKVTEIRNEHNTVMRDMGYIKGKLGVAGRNYSTNTARFWRAEVDKRAEAIRKIVRERADYKRLSENQAKEIEKYKKLLAGDGKENERSARIASLRNDLNQNKIGKGGIFQLVSDQKGRIDHLEQVITDDGKKPMPALQLKPDSPECYKEVRGSIEYVNNEYGFVQINIGKNYMIVQEYGIKKNNVHFPLQAGLTMTVVRGSGDTAEFVAKILVKTVNADNAICNVIKGNVSDIKVKDKVFFSDEDIAGIPAALKTK